MAERDPAGHRPVPLAGPALAADRPHRFRRAVVRLQRPAHRVNREYVLSLTSAVNSFGGAVQKHIAGLGEAVRDQGGRSPHQDQLEKVADASGSSRAGRAEPQREQAARRATPSARRPVRRRQAAHGATRARTRPSWQTSWPVASCPRRVTVDDLLDRLVDADTNRHSATHRSMPGGRMPPASRAPCLRAGFCATLSSFPDSTEAADAFPRPAVRSPHDTANPLAGERH